MSTFQPSNVSTPMGGDLGFWPLDTVSSWLADEKEAALAYLGVAAGPEAYDTIPSRMMVTPGNAMEAYDQAIYFLALARRRADYENENAAASALTRAVSVLQSEQVALKNANVFCSFTGWGCPSKGMTSVLQYAIDSIGTSGLNPEDTTRILIYLKSAKRGAIFWQVLPYVAVGSVVAGSVWLYSRKK